jgi:hypothetical protein
VSDERGDRDVAAPNTTDDRRDQDDLAQEDYPLTVRSLFFWAIVIVLGLLGTCVLVAILLALMKGS